MMNKALWARYVLPSESGHDGEAVDAKEILLLVLAMLVSELLDKEVA